MNWFVFRQHRKQFLIFGLLVAAFAAFVIPTGVHYWHSYQHALANAQNCGLTNVCDSMEAQVFGSGAGQFAKNAVFAVGLFAPLLVGLFLGSPLIAKEYDEGTNKLVWTQSVSRRKWLRVKLSWALGFALLYGLIITLLTTWWLRTANALYLNRFNPGMFDVQGLMPIADSLFFTAIGFTIGTWFRKIMLALGITIGAFVVLQAVFPNFIRPHYMAPTTVTSAMGPDAISGHIPKGANWMLSRNIVDGNGKVVHDIFPSAPPACKKLTQDIQVSAGGRVAKIKASGKDPLDDCLNQNGWHQVAKYQPSYRYWDFQCIEASIYLGMTALAVGVTYWLVLRRDA